MRINKQKKSKQPPKTPSKQETKSGGMVIKPGTKRPKTVKF